MALALDATLIVRGPAGEREIPVADFFTDYLTTSLQPGEILTAIRIPKLGPGWGCRYEKFHRTAQSWATVGVAALARRANGTVAEVRIGLTNMGSVPVRARAAEDAFAGVPAERDALRATAHRAADGTEPPGDLHGAPDYRRHWPACSPAGRWPQRPEPDGGAGGAQAGRVPILDMRSTARGGPGRAERRPAGSPAICLTLPLACQRVHTPAAGRQPREDRVDEATAEQCEGSSCQLSRGTFARVDVLGYGDDPR